jgi:hypothetical protein
LPFLIERIRSGDFSNVPLFEARRDPRGEWVEALHKAVNGKGFAKLHDKLVLNEADVRQCFSGGT